VTPELALLRHAPPDGAVCGVIAARELRRGPWVAPAGVPFLGVIGLAPSIGEPDWVQLFDAQVNLLHPRPGLFTQMCAHTLSPDRLLVQLSVRRLLIYLRKLALRRGMEYVFEPNNERFRRRVEAGLERTLDELAARGALAAYQVVTGEGLNTPNDVDNGRFIVALKIAPASPIEFITVALLRTGEGLLQVVEA
jgi:phage tail sheath protein FI